MEKEILNNKLTKVERKLFNYLVKRDKEKLKILNVTTK